MSDYTIRAITDADREWVARFVTEQWGSDMMVMHGDVLYISQQEGFLAEMDGYPVGLASYRIADGECEITSLDSLQKGLGIGSALIQLVRQKAVEAGCRRLFLVTTNDNTYALRFYQRRGFVLSALRRNAVSEARKIKPEIPLTGDDGIPIRDELELEMDLRSAS